MPFLLYVLAAAVFAQGTSEFMLSGLLPGIAADLDVPVAAAGRLSSAYAAGIVLGAPVLALLARRWPPRAALVACLALFVGAHVAAARAASLDALLALRVVAAVANAGFVAVTLATIATVVAEDRRGRALAVVLGGTTLALVAGVPAGALVGSALGWRATLWCVAAVATACLVAVAALVPAGSANGPAAPVGSLASPSATPDVDVDAGLGGELAALRRPAALAIAGLAVLVNAATFCTYTFLAPVVTGAGLPPSAVPVVLVVWGGGAFAGVTVAGRLADAHWRPALAVGGPVLVAAWLALLALAASGAAVLGLAAGVGLLCFGVGSLLIARIMAETRGAAVLAGAFATVALNLGAVLGPVVGGAALDGAGPRGPIAASAALAAAALLLGLALARIRGSRV